MKFSYQARTKEGKIENGTVDASSKEAAADLLQKYNVFVISLKEVARPIFSVRGQFLKKKTSKKSLAIFSRQLAVMLDSRVPVIQALLSLAAQAETPEFRETLTRISELLEEGNNLSDAFSFFPDIFDSYFINLVKSGESSGKISESLYYIGDHLEKEFDMNAKIKGVMIYPALVLSALGGVMIIVMTTVMPKITGILKELGTNPPLSTRIMLGFYNFLLNYGWIIAIAFIGLIIFLVNYLRGTNGKKNFDIILLKIPFIGSFYKKSYLARFAENLSTLVAAGLPITNALKITKNTISNYVYREVVAETEKEVSEGEKISTVLIRYPDLIPAFVIQMVKVGEETGKLDKTLLEIVNFYQKEIQRAVDSFMTLVEPLMIIVLGIAIALVAASVISPLYGMLGSI